MCFHARDVTHDGPGIEVRLRNYVYPRARGGDFQCAFCGGKGFSGRLDSLSDPGFSNYPSSP